MHIVVRERNLPYHNVGYDCIEDNLHMIAKKISRFIRYYFAKAEKILLNRPAITGSSVIHQKAKVCSGSQINDTVLGRYSYIGHDCFTCQVQIGAFCSIADNCRIGGHKHAMERVSTSPVF